jgi:hypothetical protein
MNDQSPHRPDAPTSGWPWWKLLVAAFWPSVVIFSYLRLVVLPLLLSLFR